MYSDVEEIKKLIKTQEDDTAFGELRDQMESDFGLLTLEEYSAESGYNSYTSSAPRNFFDKVLDGLNRSQLSIQIKLPEKASEKDRRAASTGELYLFGALSDIDRTMRNRGEPPLRQQVGFYLCARGWIAGRALVYVKDDNTIFDVQATDPLHVTYERGSRGFIWWANKRKLTKAQIKSEYDKDIDEKDAEGIDWWDEDSNTIIIKDEAVKGAGKHGIGHPPVYVGSVGSMPTIQTKDGESAIQHRGDSVWAASRNLYKPLNQITSRIMDSIDRSVVGSIKHYSTDGTKDLGSDPYRTYQEIKLSRKDEEDIEPLELPKLPPEIVALDQKIQQDIAQSTLPYPLAYGGTKAAETGVALSTRLDQTKSVYNPRTEALEQYYMWLCEELLSQFAENAQGPTELKGYGSDGQFFSVKVKPKDINPNWSVEVKCEPTMPRDKEAEIMMALAATSKRGPEDEPLMDYQTAREDILHLRDPDAIEDKILVQWGKRLEPIRNSRVVEALVNAGEKELAAEILRLLQSQGGGQPPPEGGAGAPVGAQPPPNQPPPALVQLVDQLAQNPQTAPIAQAIVQAVSGGQQPPM